MPVNGRLLVYERMMDDDRSNNLEGLLASLNMLLASAGGFDTTGAQVAEWLREAGFRDVESRPLVAGFGMVTGVKR